MNAWFIHNASAYFEETIWIAISNADFPFDGILVTMGVNTRLKALIL